MTFDEACTDVRGWLSLKMVTGRCSSLLVKQLAACVLGRAAHVHRIYDELGRLESPRSISGTKSPKQFTHPTSPLKRLWHQHWFEPSFLGKNLANDLKSPETKKILEELCSAINQDLVWDQHLYDIIIGGYQRRCCAGKMTGEWIVFAKIESMNYYLTLALHSEPDEMIFERIKDCISKFPEIRSSIEHGEWDDPGAEMGIP